MSQRGTDTTDHVTQFAPKARSRGDGDAMAEPGQSIVSKIQQAVELSNESCDRAMALAHKLSIQLRAAEDRINELEAETHTLRDQVARAEQWLQLIEKELEERLLVPLSQKAARQ
jgi:hypothetical protein